MMDNGFSPVVAATSPPSAAAGRRPKSAGAFPSAARKLLIPSSTTAATSFHSVVASSSPPFCTRYQSRARLTARGGAVSTAGTTASAWTPHQLKNVPTTALVVPVSPARPRTAFAGIARQVVREEIELQRRVTQDAQRQLHNLQRELSSREKEIQLLQQQLDKLRERQQQSSIQIAPVSSLTADGASVVAQDKHTGDKVSSAPSTRLQPPVIPTLREQLASQDAYKKRLRHMLDRLARNVQLMAASEELLRQQTACASHERSLFTEKLAQDRNLCRELETQRAHVLQQRQAFKQDSGHLLETYRDEIATRSEVSAQRQAADRRRHNLLQLMESRPSASEESSIPANTSASGRPVVCPAEAVLRRSQADDLSQRHLIAMNAIRRSQRRNSCAVLAADALSRRESVFELYEAQYDRILAETGESDVIRVLEGFLGFVDSQKRLMDIEQELATESDRLEQELQAHAVLLRRLRSSGIAEVEKRKKIRDYLEHVMHERQVEKAHAKETFGEHAKLFLYIQQGVLNVADLLHCLDDRCATPTQATVMATPTPGSLSASSSVIVGGTRVPVVAGAVSVSDAAFTLSTLIHHALLVLRIHGAVAAPIKFTTDEVDQLARFMPDFLIDRLVSSTGVPTKLLRASEAGNNSNTGDGVDLRRQSTMHSQVDQEEDLEQTDVSSVRRVIKQQEKETLKEVEALFRTIDARKQRQAASAVLAASSSADGDRQHRLLSTALGSLSTVKARQQPVAVYDMSPSAIQSALASPETEEDMREKLEAVHVFFREKRKHEQLLRDRADGRSTHSSTGAGSMLGDGGSGEPRPPTRPQDDTGSALAGEVVKRKLLRRKGSVIARPSHASSDVGASSSGRDYQQAPGQTAATATSSGNNNQTPGSSGDGRRSSNGGARTAISSSNVKGQELTKRKGSARVIRGNPPR